MQLTQVVCVLMSVFVCDYIYPMYVEPVTLMRPHVEILGNECSKVVPSHIHVTGLNSEFSFSYTGCPTLLRSRLIGNIYE